MQLMVRRDSCMHDYKSRFQWESISYNFRQWMEILMGQQNENKNDEAET